MPSLGRVVFPDLPGVVLVGGCGQGKADLVGL